MDYRLDDEVVALHGALRAFLGGRMPDPGAEPGRDDRLSAWRELVDSEWLEHLATSTRPGTRPEEWVGALHVAEAFGAVPVPGPVDVVAGYLVPLAVATGWSELLTRLRDGSLVTTVVPGLGVPAADGAPPGRPRRLPAVPAGATVRLTGVLARVPCAADATAVVVPIELGGGPALALVDVHRAGVEISEPYGVDLRRPVADVEFRETELDRAAVYAAPDLSAQEDRGAVGHSLYLDAEAVGGGSEVLARTVGYCTARTQFGRPVGSFQAVRHRLASAAAQIEGARSLAYRAAWDTAAGSPGAGADVVASRLWASTAYLAAAEAAVQCHGGMGFTWEQRVHLWYRAALAGRGAGTDRPTSRALVAAHLRDLAETAAADHHNPGRTT